MAHLGQSTSGCSYFASATSICHRWAGSHGIGPIVWSCPVAKGSASVLIREGRQLPNKGKPSGFSGLLTPSLRWRGSSVLDHNVKRFTYGCGSSTKPGGVMGYRIGVDVGDRSVGLAAVRYDGDRPVEVLCAVSHIHDGGQDPDTGRSPQSRLATSGVARRARRLLRNRRRRLRRLDHVLLKHGFPVPAGEVPQTYEAWLARAALVEAKIVDDQQRGEWVSLAVRHLARHRGWRNPWWSVQRLREAPTPSEDFTKLLAEAHARFRRPEGTWSTLGQVAAASADPQVALRPRTSRRPELKAKQPAGAVMSTKIRQEDSLAELIQILTTQEVADDAIDDIVDSVFFQHKPHVPIERIGADELPGMGHLPRAPRASLEFQEFRVRAAVANLRIREHGTVRPLTEDEYDNVCEALLEWREPDSPRWLDVADLLGVSTRALVRPALDEDGGGSIAPFDRTSRNVEAAFPAKSEVAQWWKAASPEDRADVVAVVTDASVEESTLPDSVADARDSWSAESWEKWDKVTLEAGRAAYSRESLVRLNEVMRQRRCDVYEARREAFGVPPEWQPSGASFDDPIEHPTVARVNTLVRRFMLHAVQQWGVPDRVVVEHVRSAFLGPTAKAEFLREIDSNRRRREQTAASLKMQGLEEPRARDILRNECIQRQNSICLYCGADIGLLTSELDHILADSLGGSNRRENLVAVCRLCNSDKGKRPFVVFAKASTRPGVSVDEARERLRSWSRPQGVSISRFRRFTQDVSRRLGLDEDPEPIQDRSIESTAYAAREMHARITRFLTDHATQTGADPGTVSVYSGSVTSEARKAGGIDTRLQLRGKNTKSRYDRRHHAIDAAVLTSIDDGIAKTLRERSQLRRSEEYEGTEPKTWKTYTGSSQAARDHFATWTSNAADLATLLTDLIAADRVPVVRPLRLTPSVGAIHKDTIEPLARKDPNEAWTVSEVARVTNPHLRRTLTAELGSGNDLPADPHRSLSLGLQPGELVSLLPSESAYLLVRGGAAAIGDTARIARIYAWKQGNTIKYGMIRLYPGEFTRIGLHKPGVDLLTVPIPRDSEAWRTAPTNLTNAIADGRAGEIGWITLGDEIEIDIDRLSEGSTKMARFLQAEPETRWTITGFYGREQISIAPHYLAAEGLPEDESLDPIVGKVLNSNRVPLSVGVLLSGDPTTIIRRTITGRPRWTGTELPRSWQPAEQVAALLEP